ncbi:MAG: ribosome-associated translation inhibitor RaiA [Bryobacter sp.]
MKIHYTGKLEELDKDQKKNLDAHYAKLGKMVDRRGEREAHVVLTTVRHLKKAEITMNYYGHSAVGTATTKDQFMALLGAISKLEKQLHKIRDKWNDSKRHGDNVNGKKAGGAVAGAAVAAKAVSVVVPTKEQMPSILMAKVQRSAKPLTIEEAALTLRAKNRYLVFEDAETGHMSVLLRSDDGNLELIETR